MKKRILITAMSLDVGGVEKSLINLLNMLNYDLYDVDLLLFQRRGPFLKQVPAEVHIIKDKVIDYLYNYNHFNKSNDISLIKEIKLLFIKLFFNLYERLKWKQFDRIRIHRWIDIYSKQINNNDKIYDIAISYSGGETAYYIFDKVKSTKKVYYFHSDYSKINIDPKIESYYVNQANLIVTISDECKKSLITLFPNCANRIIVLQNAISPILIKKLGEESYPVEYANTNVFKIVSVGRLHHIKGYDMAIEAAMILKNKGHEFKWFVVGEGKERKKLEKLISKYNLNNSFILLGMKENPYPYILNSDLLVQPSRFEGKSMVLDEARILNVPVLATNYNSIKDQIDNNVDGFIVEMNPESIAQGIMKIIDNRKVLNTIKANIISSQNNIITDDIDKYMNTLLEGVIDY